MLFPCLFKNESYVHMEDGVSGVVGMHVPMNVAHEYIPRQDWWARKSETVHDK